MSNPLRPNRGGSHTHPRLQIGRWAYTVAFTFALSERNAASLSASLRRTLAAMCEWVLEATTGKAGCFG